MLANFDVEACEFEWKLGLIGFAKPAIRREEICTKCVRACAQQVVHIQFDEADQVVIFIVGEMWLVRCQRRNLQVLAIMAVKGRMP